MRAALTRYSINGSPKGPTLFRELETPARIFKDWGRNVGRVLRMRISWSTSPHAYGSRRLTVRFRSNSFGGSYLERFLPPELFLPPRLRGTLAPFFLASESPIAIACLRLFTVLPLLPDLSVPFLRRRIALSTRFDAALPYFLPPEDFFAAIRLTSSKRGSSFCPRPLAHLVP